MNRNMQLRDFKHQVFLTIHPNNKQRFMELEWEGYASHSDTDQGWEAVSAELQRRKPQRVLHNAERRRGTPELTPESLRRWFIPALKAAGCTQVAIIRPDSLMALIGASQVEQLLEAAGLNYEFFDDRPEALAWLVDEEMAPVW